MTLTTSPVCDVDGCGFPMSMEVPALFGVDFSNGTPVLTFQGLLVTEYELVCHNPSGARHVKEFSAPVEQLMMETAVDVVDDEIRDALDKATW